MLRVPRGSSGRQVVIVQQLLLIWSGKKTNETGVSRVPVNMNAIG